MAQKVEAGHGHRAAARFFPRSAHPLSPPQPASAPHSSPDYHGCEQSNKGFRASIFTRCSPRLCSHRCLGRQPPAAVEAGAQGRRLPPPHEFARNLGTTTAQFDPSLRRLHLEAPIIGPGWECQRSVGRQSPKRQSLGSQRPFARRGGLQGDTSPGPAHRTFPNLRTRQPAIQLSGDPLQNGPDWPPSPITRRRAGCDRRGIFGFNLHQPIARQHGAWMARRPPREPENRRVRLDSRNRHAHRAPPILDVTKREARITQPLRGRKFQAARGDAQVQRGAQPPRQATPPTGPRKLLRKKSADDGS